MRGNAKRIISLCLAVIIAVTTVGYAPPSLAATAMTRSKMLDAVSALASPSQAEENVAETAAPSEAESPGDKATPSEAENPGDKATPSEAVRKFVQVEPEEVPDYYSKVKKVGKRFWKFEDRNGMVQYRDYGYVDGDAEFPLWYEADQTGTVEDLTSSINLDEEYYSLAPYIFKSVVPDKKAWVDLSWRLFFDSFSIEEYDKENIGGFKNWDASSYSIWHLTGAEDDQGYHFYGTILNESKTVKEPNWYDSDNEGNVVNIRNLLMTSLATSEALQKLYYSSMRIINDNVSVADKTDSPGTYDTADTLFTLWTPSWSGYTFLGWSDYYNYPGGEPFGNHSVIDHPQNKKWLLYGGGFLKAGTQVRRGDAGHLGNLYGMWKPNGTYTLQLLRQPAEEYYPTLYHGSNAGNWYLIVGNPGRVIDLEDYEVPTLEGYTFAGWYSGKHGTGTHYNGSITLNSNMVLYANYTVNTNTITFLDYNGEIIGEPQSVVTGDSAIPPQAPEIDGMDFVGWDNSFTNVSKDMVIKAQYKKLPNITIIYRDVYSSSANIIKTETIVAKGKATPPEVDSSSLPAPKTGFHYTGTWYGSAGTNMPDVDLDCVETFDSKNYYKDSTLYLYPKQEGDMVKVTLHSNDGQDVTKVIEIQYDSSLYFSQIIDSQIYTKGLVETRTGYTFKGWASTSDAKYSNLRSVEPYDQDIYQVWDAITYYVIFDKRVSGESNPSKFAMIYDKPIGKLPEVTSKGLDFLGWFTYYYGGTQVTEETLMPNRDFNLYAQWSRYPTKITLDYQYEGGPNPYTYTMYTADYTYYQIYTNIADRTPPTRKGYKFKWWNTKPDSKGKTFYKGSNSYYVPESRDITVYAIWEPLTVYIKLYKNTSSSDTSALSSASRKFDSPVGSLAVPTNGDKVFKGWYTARTGGTLVSEDYIVSNYTVNGILNSWELYAQWANSQNKVTFKDWDNSVLSEQTIDYGQDAVPPEPERAGYRFIGWDKSYKDIQGDTVITAQYEIVSKTLTLDSNGGRLSDQLTIEKPIAPDESIDQILMDVKAGAIRNYYTFDGWYTDKTEGSKYPESGNKMPDNDLTIYAHWKRSSSEVVFKDWNESVLDKQEVAIGADATAPTVPTVPERIGYTFTGWDKPTTNIQDHTILTAQYTINSHKLTLVGNGGTLAGEESKSQSVNFDASLDQVLAEGTADASRKYYTFDGWYTDKTGGSKYSESGNKMPDTDLTIYAHWERNSSEVVFKDWNGSVLYKQEVAIGADATPPAAPERIGYTFTGWDKPTTDIQDHTILTAQYTINSHKLTLVGNGGTLAGEESKNQSVSFGASLDQALVDGEASASRKYYTFDGWYTDKTGGSKYPESGNKMPDTDLNIYAHWERSSSEVVFKDWDESVLDKQEVAIGADATAPTAPERIGYTFTGWDKPTTNIQDHVVITAQYSINGYLLTLDGTGGTLEGMPKKEVVISFDQSFDQVLKDGRDQVTRLGYHFDGWYNSASGGSSYSYSGNQMPSINVTVYAHWSPNTYEVTFDPDHVRWTGGKQKEDHTFDTELGTFPAPEIYGWKFNGWWTGKNGSGTKITEHSMVEAKDVVYYGSWEPVTYEVLLVSKTEQPDGESLQTFTINQKYDQEFGSLPIPEEKGYTFNGWYDEDHNIINPHTIFRPDSGAAGYTYHAEWKANSYKIRFVYIDADGKQKVVEIDRDYFMQLGTLPLPEKPGYTFAGWFNESGEKINSESWVEAGNMEYKAKWIANQYTIRFKSNSESISDPKDKTVTYALPIGDLPILHETGYAFLGWYTETVGGIRIRETTLAALGDQTYYGHWSISWINNGNGSYRRPGADGRWNTADDELWWYGLDGIIGTDDDRQIHIIPGGTGTYIDNGDGTYITPGAGGSWENPDHWWRGPDGELGTDDDRQIHIIPGGTGTYIDNGDGTYITPGADGSWEN
ncbi:InlB B-repeat-containing protein, partial [Clostridium boliviensis]